MDDARLAFLSLRLSRGIGELRLGRLLARFGDAASALAAPIPDLVAAGLSRAHAASLRDGHGRRLAEAELQRAAALGVTLVLLGDAAYPAPLRALADAPPVLWLRGALPGPDDERIALVGTRAPDAYGVSVATGLARALAEAGAWVLSGGAHGVDAAAHQGALLGRGRTLVLLGSAVDVPYPADHAALYERVVAAGGGLVSELPLGTGPRQGTFPRRNRLIAALARAMAVVQAAPRSGSLLTAELARGLSRPVLAVPGPVDRALSRGTHSLLREGALLCEDAEDLLRAARSAAPGPERAVTPGPAAPPAPTTAPDRTPAPAPRRARAPATAPSSDGTAAQPRLPLPPAPGTEEALVHGAVGPEGATLDEVCARTRLDVPRVAAALLQLELGGALTHRQGVYRRA